ncbi:MAG: glycosyltransferase [Luteimonas sp.]
MTLVRVISRDNGAGLTRDLALVADALRDGGHDVEVVAFGSEKGLNALRESGLRIARLWRGRADVQIFAERIYPRMLALARRNLLIPNPEWFAPQWTAQLPAFERVLCKTAHARTIFDGLGVATALIGFTSDDRLDTAVSRERAFFHGAGRSSAKGTQVLMDTWRRHPEWPRLTVVQGARSAVRGPPAGNIDHRIGYLADATLRQLQNAHSFHICPSEMEGFGHVLMEAMSVGAVTLTTDGAPMNELVRPDRGWLIAPVREASKNLSPRYFVDAAGIETAVAHALRASDDALAAMRATARASFQRSQVEFRQRLADVVNG